MNIRRIFQPLIMSTKPDGTVEYKPIATSDNSDDAVTNIFVPKEDSSQQMGNNGPQGFSFGSARA